jgi:hypothetical protein
MALALRRWSRNEFDPLIYSVECWDGFSIFLTLKFQRHTDCVIILFHASSTFLLLIISLWDGTSINDPNILTAGGEWREGTWKWEL